MTGTFEGDLAEIKKLRGLDFSKYSEEFLRELKASHEKDGYISWTCPRGGRYCWGFKKV